MALCSVRPSLIDGLGLFADAFIPAGSMVWAFDPRFDVIIGEADIATATPRILAFLERFGYARRDMPGCLVVDSDDDRYINHADDPNLDSLTPGQGVARRDIARGEEITCNYNELEPREYTMAAPREHFSPGCRASARETIALRAAALVDVADDAGSRGAVSSGGTASTGGSAVGKPVLHQRA